MKGNFMYLIDCPNCGGKGRIHSDDELLPLHYSYVSCTKCGASTEMFEAFWKSDAYDRAKRAWNRGEVHKTTITVK